MNAFHFAIGGALFGVGTPMAMLWNGAGQPSTWFWIASGVFGGLSGAFFVLVMRLASPEWFDRILTSREHGVVRLLMVPTAIGAVLLFVGQGALMSHGGDVESPLPLVLLLAGALILLFPILIGGTMSLIVQLTVPRMDAEPTEAAESN
jgi:hypothetical protein